MSEQTGQFRSAAFGGFHRQDVLDYLEKLTKEKQDLESRLASESERRSQAEERLAAAEEELRTAREAWETMRAELDYLRNEVEERAEAMSRSEEEVKVLRAQVEALRPAAESWEHIKEQAGDIEISAHERAQITIQNAQDQASGIQGESIQYVLAIQNSCEKLQADLKTSLISAEQELDQARAAFGRAEEEMDGYQRALEQLLASIEPPGDE